MSVAQDLRELDQILERLTTFPLKEDKGHLDHPEDLVFLQDIYGAQHALKAMQQTIRHPKAITIKWDGYPALIFGRDSKGRFSIMDKHMFNKKDGTGRQVYSPKQFQQYDLARGVDRTDLHRLIAEIWPGLEKASRGSKGYYWGDLLFSKPLEPQGGLYKFKANPNGITYTVDPKSPVGKLIAGKTAGIAVHQQIAPDMPSTDYAQTLNGGIGTLKNNSNVAIVPSAMPVKPILKVNPALEKAVTAAITKYGEAAKQLMTTAPQSRNSFNQLFTTYINKRIVSGNLENLFNGFVDYVKTRPMSEPMKKKLLGYDIEQNGKIKHIPGHLEQNKEGLIGIFTIWIAIYKLKMSIVSQLNDAATASPVKGYLQDGTETQEGFVSQGLKFVDRMGFSRQNLAGR